MEVSKILTTTTSLTLDAIFRASKADIRMHGISNVPEESIVYVINHFTRMETTFLPYLIMKHTHKYPLSLAHESFFTGNLAKILTKYGAVSTNDPERDRKLLGSLLPSKMPVLIFPEGQMLKDKKLIEKGKYMVYNTGIRRPPHTGAARLAFLAEFYRSKMRYFYNEGLHSQIDEYMKYFEFTEEDLSGVFENETVIVPVNLTYFPIRARSNAINRFLEKIVKQLPDRFEEELEVEGTMLLEGVDIDINFGRPIRIKPHISANRIQKAVRNSETLLKKEDYKSAFPLQKNIVRLTQQYMSSIYSMTTLNHDHIFSYLLFRSKAGSISEHDLKNRAFLAIEKIKSLNLVNCHSSLNKNQCHLITDDEHEKYRSFIEAVKSNGLITISDGMIQKNRQRFNAPYIFHRVRKDNIVEVYKNEIEPLTKVTRILDIISLEPSRRIRKTIRKMFISMDRAMFDKDYNKYYHEEESKNRDIGAPYLLKRFNSKKGVIVIHGYMAAPEETRLIAEKLFDSGYTVYGVRLRGHGTSPEDLARRKWEDWYNSVNRAYIIMNNLVEEISILGFSTGAGLALLQAARKENKYKSVVSISAPLKLQNIASGFSSAVVKWNSFLKKIKVERGNLEFVINNPENPDINYFRNPLYGVYQLDKLMDIVDSRLKDISIPSLIIQGSDDPVVNPQSADEIFRSLSNSDRAMFRIFSKRHGIVRGDTYERVASEVISFLNRIHS